MKRIVMLLLAAVLVLTLTGCSSVGAAGVGMLTAEEAEDAALAHAGLSRGSVEFLHTEYEVDRGVPQYEVDFSCNGREYDYRISAENGQILEFSQENQ